MIPQDVVTLIEKAAQAGDAAGFEHFRKAGELLIEAKVQMRDDEWPGWIKRNLGLSVKEAQKYMELAAFHKFGFGVRP